jgi:hypothetical protein
MSSEQIELIILVISFLFITVIGLSPRLANKIYNLFENSLFYDLFLIISVYNLYMGFDKEMEKIEHFLYLYDFEFNDSYIARWVLFDDIYRIRKLQKAHFYQIIWKGLIYQRYSLTSDNYKYGISKDSLLLVIKRGCYNIFHWARQMSILFCRDIGDSALFFMEQGRIKEYLSFYGSRISYSIAILVYNFVLFIFIFPIYLGFYFLKNKIKLDVFQLSGYIYMLVSLFFNFFLQLIKIIFLRGFAIVVKIIKLSIYSFVIIYYKCYKYLWVSIYEPFNEKYLRKESIFFNNNVSNKSFVFNFKLGFSFVLIILHRISLLVIIICFFYLLTDIVTVFSSYYYHYYGVIRTDRNLVFVKYFDFISVNLNTELKFIKAISGTWFEFTNFTNFQYMETHNFQRRIIRFLKTVYFHGWIRFDLFFISDLKTYLLGSLWLKTTLRMSAIADVLSLFNFGSYHETIIYKRFGLYKWKRVPGGIFVRFGHINSYYILRPHWFVVPIWGYFIDFRHNYNHNYKLYFHYTILADYMENFYEGTGRHITYFEKKWLRFQRFQRMHRGLPRVYYEPYMFFFWKAPIFVPNWRMNSFLCKKDFVFNYEFFSQFLTGNYKIPLTGIFLRENIYIYPLLFILFVCIILSLFYNLVGLFLRLIFLELFFYALFLYFDEVNLDIIRNNYAVEMDGDEIPYFQEEYSLLRNKYEFTETAYTDPGLYTWWWRKIRNMGNWFVSNGLTPKDIYSVYYLNCNFMKENMGSLYIIVKQWPSFYDLFLYKRFFGDFLGYEFIHTEISPLLTAFLDDDFDNTWYDELEFFKTYFFYFFYFFYNRESVLILIFFVLCILEESMERLQYFQKVNDQSKKYWSYLSKYTHLYGANGFTLSSSSLLEEYEDQVNWDVLRHFVRNPQVDFGDASEELRVSSDAMLQTSYAQFVKGFNRLYEVTNGGLFSDKISSQIHFIQKFERFDRLFKLWFYKALDNKILVYKKLICIGKYYNYNSNPFLSALFLLNFDQFKLLLFSINLLPFRKDLIEFNLSDIRFELFDSIHGNSNEPFIFFVYFDKYGRFLANGENLLQNKIIASGAQWVVPKFIDCSLLLNQYGDNANNKQEHLNQKLILLYKNSYINFEKFCMSYNNYDGMLDSVDFVLSPYFNEEVYEQEVEKNEALEDLTITEYLFYEFLVGDFFVVETAGMTQQKSVIYNFDWTFDVMYDLFFLFYEYTLEEFVIHNDIFYLNFENKDSDFWAKAIKLFEPFINVKSEMSDIKIKQIFLNKVNVKSKGFLINNIFDSFYPLLVNDEQGLQSSEFFDNMDIFNSLKDLDLAKQVDENFIVKAKKDKKKFNSDSFEVLNIIRNVMHRFPKFKIERKETYELYDYLYVLLTMIKSFWKNKHIEKTLFIPSEFQDALFDYDKKKKFDVINNIFSLKLNVFAFWNDFFDVFDEDVVFNDDYIETEADDDYFNLTITDFNIENIKHQPEKNSFVVFTDTLTVPHQLFIHKLFFDKCKELNVYNSFYSFFDTVCYNFDPNAIEIDDYVFDDENIENYFDDDSDQAFDKFWILDDYDMYEDVTNFSSEFDDRLNDQPRYEILDWVLEYLDDSKFIKNLRDVFENKDFSLFELLNSKKIAFDAYTGVGYLGRLPHFLMGQTSDVIFDYEEEISSVFSDFNDKSIVQKSPLRLRHHMEYLEYLEYVYVDYYGKEFVHFMDDSFLLTDLNIVDRLKFILMNDRRFMEDFYFAKFRKLKKFRHKINLPLNEWDSNILFLPAIDVINSVSNDFSFTFAEWKKHLLGTNRIEVFTQLEEEPSNITEDLENIEEEGPSNITEDLENIEEDYPSNIENYVFYTVIKKTRKGRMLDIDFVSSRVFSNIYPLKFNNDFVFTMDLDRNISAKLHEFSWYISLFYNNEIDNYSKVYNEIEFSNISEISFGLDNVDYTDPYYFRAHDILQYDMFFNSSLFEFQPTVNDLYAFQDYERDYSKLSITFLDYADDTYDWDNFDFYAFSRYASIDKESFDEKIDTIDMYGTQEYQFLGSIGAGLEFQWNVMWEAYKPWSTSVYWLRQYFQKFKIFVKKK